MRSYQNLQLKQKLNEKLSRNFPISNIKYAYAYGSAVIPQKDYTGKMIDMFFIVDDIKKFHIDNLRNNSQHYSSLARNSCIATLENVNRFGSGVYYNPSVLLEKELLIKYGVVSEKDFINNMTRWENLFIAGRFHKPVIPIFKEDENIKQIINKNRDAAFSLCVLKNIQKINKIDFYVDLANLSYMGDIRTYLRAEKKDKIKNVVIGAIEYYDDIYRDIIEKYNISKDPEIFEFIPEMNLMHLDNLPYPFVNSLMLYTKAFNKEEFKYNFCGNMNYNERRYIIDSYLKKMNLLYSCKGIISGVYSTDLNKSIKYVFEKYRKSLNII